jgi:hypothetical protein
MGHWGVKSYENDDAGDALDAGFEEVHGALYEKLMDDRNPLTFEQVQKRLADTRTLVAAVAALEQMIGSTPQVQSADWDESARLALAGIVVRHAECGVQVPPDLLARALQWLGDEEIQWENKTKRQLRKNKEIALLRRCLGASSETAPSAAHALKTDQTSS